MSKLRDAIRVFISYSRQQTSIADALAADLSQNGFEVAIDRRELPYGEEWQHELADLIRGSDVVLWLASHNSVQSRWCKWELGEALRASKRLVPVRVDEIAPESLPEVLGRIQSLPAEGAYDRTAHLGVLVAVLRENRRWIKEHTRLADRAGVWISGGRLGDQLLRGRALKEAEHWRDERPAVGPAPGGDTLELILESRRASTRRLQQQTIGLLVLVAILVLVSVFAWEQKKIAQIGADTVTLEREVAVGRLELRETPTAGLRRITEAARRNDEEAKTGRIPLLENVHSGLLEALDTARQIPRLMGYQQGRYGEVFEIGNAFTDADNAVTGHLVGMRETVLVIDDAGRPLIPPISAPDLGPTFANAAIWLGPKRSDGFAVASGEVTAGKIYAAAVTLYDGDGRQRVRLLSDSPHPFLSLEVFPGGRELLAGDSFGNLFRINVTSGTVDRISEGRGKALTGIVRITGDTLFLVYGWIPASDSNMSPLPSVGYAFERGDADAIAAKLGESKLKVFAVGTNRGDEPRCLGRSSDALFVCDSRGGVSIWKGQYATTWPYASLESHINVAEGARASAVAYDSSLGALAISDANGGIQLFSINGEALTPIIRSSARRVYAIGFTKGGQELWAAIDGEISRYDLSDIQGNTRRITGLYGYDIAASSDGRLRILFENNYDAGARVAIYDKRIADEEKRVRFFPLPDGTQLSDQMLAVSNSGDLLAWTQPGALCILDPTLNREPLVLRLPDDRKPAILQFDAHDRFLMVALTAKQDVPKDGSFDVTKTAAPLLRLYRLPKVIAETTLVREWEDETAAPLSAVVGLPTSARTVGNDTAIFASGDAAGRVGIWSADGTLLHRSEALVGPRSERLAIKKLANISGKALLLLLLEPADTQFQLAAETTIAKWSTATQSIVLPLTRVSRTVQAVGLDASGDHIAVGSSSGLLGRMPIDIKIFGVNRLQEIKTLPWIGDSNGADILWFEADLDLHALSRSMDEKNWQLGVGSLLERAKGRLAAWDRADRFDALLNEDAALAGPTNRVRKIAVLRRAVDTFGDDKSSWLRLGNLLYPGLIEGAPPPGGADAGSALDAYNKAVSIDPYDLIARLRRGRLHFRLGRFEDARIDFSEAMRLPFSYMTPLRVRQEVGAIAFPLFQKTLELRKNSHYEAAALLAYTLVQLERWEDAETALTHVISNYGGSAMDFSQRALCRARLGRSVEAASDAAEAITRLEGPTGSYSKLDDFSALGDTAGRRAMRICQIAATTVDWLESSFAADQTAGLSNLDWLRRAEGACLTARRADPEENRTAQLLAEQARARLLQGNER